MIFACNPWPRRKSEINKSPTSQTHSIIFEEIERAHHDFLSADLLRFLTPPSKVKLEGSFEKLLDRCISSRQRVLMTWEEKSLSRLERGRNESNTFCGFNINEVQIAFTSAKREQIELQNLMEAILEDSRDFEPLVALRQVGKEHKNSNLELVFLESSNLLSRHIRAVSSPEDINIQYPAWMGPIYHFGQSAPKLTFSELIAMESADASAMGVAPAGKYTRMKQLEENTHRCALRLVGTLRFRFYSKKKLGEKTVSETKRLEAHIKTIMEQASAIELKLSRQFFGKKSLRNQLDELYSKVDELKNEILNYRPKLSETDVEDITKKILREKEVMEQMSVRWTTDIKDTVTPRDVELFDGVYENVGKERAYLRQSKEVWVLGGLTHPVLIFRYIPDRQLYRRGVVQMFQPFSYTTYTTQAMSQSHTPVLSSLRCGFCDRPTCSQDPSRFATARLSSGRFFSSEGYLSLYGNSVKFSEDLLSTKQQFIWEHVIDRAIEETRSGDEKYIKTLMKDKNDYLNESHGKNEGSNEVSVVGIGSICSR